MAGDPLERVARGLATRFPGENRMVPDLDRIVDLLDLLGDPQRAYPSVHITGTNGKTTTARMIDALLRELGIRTGRYTSPHLERMTERIALDGRPVDDERFAAAYDDVAAYVDIVDGRHPDRMTFFEVLTAMAFSAFAEAPVDVAVLEVGLGGRWDATNVVHAPVAVVTPIGLDHVGLLGDTVEAIAGEKSGILHEGAVLVTAPQPEGAAAVLARRAAEVHASGIVQVGVDVGIRSRAVAMGGQLIDISGLAGDYDEVFLPLYGAHQALNAATAVAAVEAFLGGADAGSGRGRLDPEVVRAGFASVSSPGRLEVVRRNPTVVLDAAHNPHGAAALAEALGESFDAAKVVAVVAVLSDKDAAGLLAQLEQVADVVVVTTNSSPRALPTETLADIAGDVFGADRVLVAPRLADAIEAAVTEAETDTPLGGAMVVVTGSVVTVGEARHLLLGAEVPR